eukprot:500215-Prymnesium_polylepis.2
MEERSVPTNSTESSFEKVNDLVQEEVEKMQASLHDEGEKIQALLRGKPTQGGLLKGKERRIAAIKTGIGVVITTLVPLLNPTPAFRGMGVWAVVTTILVFQPNRVGDTRRKFKQRLIGTWAAIVAAFSCGYYHIPSS